MLVRVRMRSSASQEADDPTRKARGMVPRARRTLHPEWSELLYRLKCR